MMQKSHDRTLVFHELEWQCSVLRQHYDHCSARCEIAIEGMSSLQSRYQSLKTICRFSRSPNRIKVFGLDGLWFFSCTSSGPFAEVSAVQMLVHGLKWSCHLALVNSLLERYHVFESLVCFNRECTGGGFMTHTALFKNCHVIHPYSKWNTYVCVQLYRSPVILLCQSHSFNPKASDDMLPSFAHDWQLVTLKKVFSLHQQLTQVVSTPAGTLCILWHLSTANTKRSNKSCYRYCFLN